MDRYYFITGIMTGLKSSIGNTGAAARVLTRFRGLDNASDDDGTQSQSEDHDGDDDDLPPPFVGSPREFLKKGIFDFFRSKSEKDF